MRAMNRKSAIIAIAFVGLVGFTDFFIKDDVVGKVRQFTDEVKASTRQSPALSGLEPAEIQPYKAYEYKSDGSNPFIVRNFVGRPGMGTMKGGDNMCISPDCGDSPPTPHAPYFLENYNLDQLTMIGVMKFNGRGYVALIQTPDAGVVRASQGEYIGRNNGLILSINDNRLVVQEKYQSPQGWQNRKARLPLLKK